MGLAIFDALKNTVNSQLGDQWREYFYCDALPNNVLMVKGQKKTTQKTSNKHGMDNIITNGSIVSVNEGQCMIIVDQGRIVEFCAEPGEFIFDASTESTILYGNFKENVSKTWETFKRRASFGGDTAKDQRVYYFNTKEILENPFGTASPIPFRVVDNKIGLDIDTTIRCHGTYTFKIVDPILFYRNVASNVAGAYTKEILLNQMKQELVSHLAPALATISAKGIRYSEVSQYPEEIGAALNQELSEEWVNRRGIAVVSVAMAPMRLSEEDEAMIKDLQRTAVFTNANMAGAMMAQSQAEAMKLAAANESTGPMMAFAGLNMAQMTGGMNANNLFAMGQQQQQMQMQQQQMQQQNMAFGGGMAQAAPAQQAPQAAPAPQPEAAPVAGWTCTCGATGNSGKFCMECGAKRVEPQVGWTCSCGAVNTGKFCMECGSKKPADAPLYKCDKCGWEPEDPKNPPKFCPECGDPFDDSDVQ